MSAYDTLEDRFRQIAVLEDTEGLLHWDMSTVMPPGAAEGRAEQRALVRLLSHRLLTDPETGDLLDAAEHEAGAAPAQGEDGGEDGDGGPAAWRAANLREMRRLWVHAAALPDDLVEAQARAASRAEMVWREARAGSDFARVAPALEEVLALTRRVAEAKAARLGCAPYDALLDLYEPGVRGERVDALFAPLAEWLPGFLAEALERQRAAPEPVALDGPFPLAAQRALAERFMRAVGFDFARGRLDVSHHPFCGGARDDVRITTRYNESDFAESLMGVLHETGHAMYELGLPAEWRYQPVGAARGMSVHESQSLLVEMQACRSREFIRFAAPLVAEAFGGRGPAWEAENLHRLYVRVEPGFIRVDADEVTYPAHIILRTRLERAMLAGELAVGDLPGAWNEGMEELLGLTPPDDARGCLQDIHWFCGDWGYFPTYTMGAMTAAQLFEAACRDVPEIPEALSRGDFAPLMGWLRTHVHALGSRYPTDELIARATGRPLDGAVFRRHLERRYGAGSGDEAPSPHHDSRNEGRPSP